MIQYLDAASIDAKWTIPHIASSIKKQAIPNPINCQPVEIKLDACSPIGIKFPVYIEIHPTTIKIVCAVAADIIMRVFNSIFNPFFLLYVFRNARRRVRKFLNPKKIRKYVNSGSVSYKWGEAIAEPTRQGNCIHLTSFFCESPLSFSFDISSLIVLFGSTPYHIPSLSHLWDLYLNLKTDNASIPFKKACSASLNTSINGGVWVFYYKVFSVIMGRRLFNLNTSISDLFYPNATLPFIHTMRKKLSKRLNQTGKREIRETIRRRYRKNWWCEKKKEKLYIRLHTPNGRKYREIWWREKR